LPDPVTEADEMYQNAGEKGKKHPDPEDPPRKRGNKARGHGTWDTDRPPVFGAVGRESGDIRLEVTTNSRRVDLEPAVLENTVAGATVNTDEWASYNHLSENDRRHVRVCHTPGERVWARDLDGDGVNEVHTNTMEGIWTGLRNFLRPFRGVNKVYLEQYCRVFQWCHNIKVVTTAFLRLLLGTTRFNS
jgi:transposase-like protein